MKRKIVFLFMLMAGSCDLYDGRLVLINNSKNTIVVESLSDATVNSREFNQTEYYLEAGIDPGTRRKLKETGSKGWEERLSRNRNKKINLIVFSLDSLKKHQSIDYLIDNNLYVLHSYSGDELSKMNWEVRID